MHGEENIGKGQNMERLLLSLIKQDRSNLFNKYKHHTLKSVMEVPSENIDIDREKSKLIKGI